MDSTSPSTVYPLDIVLTNKQQKLLDELRLVTSKIGIEVKINDPIGIPENALASVDVEHDESGGFVGCGLYLGTGPVYYYSSRISLDSVPFSTLRIIAHNGVSDIEILNEWRINIVYEQLRWDTMLLGHILDSSQKDYSLKSMAKRELGIEYPTYDEIVGKRGLKAERITLDRQPLELVSLYNAMDCVVTWKLYEKQKNQL